MKWAKIVLSSSFFYKFFIFSDALKTKLFQIDMQKSVTSVTRLDFQCLMVTLPCFCCHTSATYINLKHECVSYYLNISKKCSF